MPATHIHTIPSLPDPGLVFDTLLCRRSGDFVPHPGGLSSLFFAFADLIIHSIFNTNALDWTINDASSYLDLSIIYGSNMEQVESMRKKDGAGKIWDDAFADSRLLFMPPSVCALAVLFSRHHNVRLLLDLSTCIHTNAMIVYRAENTGPQRTRLFYLAYGRREDFPTCPR